MVTADVIRPTENCYPPYRELLSALQRIVSRDFCCAVSFYGTVDVIRLRGLLATTFAVLCHFAVGRTASAAPACAVNMPPCLMMAITTS